MIAITREVPRSIERGERTHVGREPIDFARARHQHEAYEDHLRDCGARVVRLPELPELPDSVFVEDGAVDLGGVAVLTRPGADSRLPEVEALATELARHRRLVRIEPPGTLDGGDVLAASRTLFVGVGARTNESGFEQLRSFALEGPYESAIAIPLGQCLHLKTAVTALDEANLILNPAWVEPSLFEGFRIVEVDPDEPFAANVLPIGAHLLCGAAFPKTRSQLERLGYAVREVDASELAKAEGALTCCSILLR